MRDCGTIPSVNALESLGRVRRCLWPGKVSDKTGRTSWSSLEGVYLAILICSQASSCLRPCKAEVVIKLTNSDHPALQIKRILTETFHLNTSSMDTAFGPQGRQAMVQIRHRMKAVPACVRPVPSTNSAGTVAHTAIECTFDEPIIGVAPGQVAAVYFGERCIGSGVIGETWSEWVEE